MASNIGTNSVFATLNMKPATGEQADALWAQNMGDNTGHVYFREVPIPPSLQPDARYVQFQFTKRASHNGLKLQFRGQPGTTGVVTTWSRVYPDGGTTAGGAGASVVATHALTHTQYQTSRIDLDISALSNGSSYVYEYEYGNIFSPQPISAWQTYGTGATY
jgi:hypothetical protein